MASISKDKKTGKWFVRVSYKDKKTGKYKVKSKHGFDTKKEASVVGAMLDEMAENGFEENDQDIVFADYFLKWAETYKFPKVSLSTQQKYLAVAALIEEHFGQIKMVNINRPKYQEFITARGVGRGQDTVEKTHYYIKSCVKNAMADGIIDKDFTFEAILTYSKPATKKAIVWNIEETKLFTQYLNQSVEFRDLMLYIAINTGLRIGEIYGLSYDDITETTLSVNRGYDYNHTHGFTGAKNEASIRTISITPTIYRKIKQYQLSNRKHNDQYLFLDNQNKERISHTALTTYLAQICSALGIKVLTAHGLRHTHCSILIYKGININYISRRMGHSTVVETMKTYSHIIDELTQSQNEKMTEVLNEFSTAKSTAKLPQNVLKVFDNL